METGVLLQRGAVAAGAGPGSQSSRLTPGPWNPGLLTGPGWAGPGRCTGIPRPGLVVVWHAGLTSQPGVPTVSAASCAPAVGRLGLAVPQIPHTSPPSPGCHHVILSTCNAHRSQLCLTNPTHAPKLSAVLCPPRSPSDPVTPGVVLGVGQGQDLLGKVTMTTPTPRPPHHNSAPGNDEIRYHVLHSCLQIEGCNLLILFPLGDVICCYDDLRT